MFLSAKTGNRWTIVEEQKLFESLQQGQTFEEIALKLQRRPRGIEYRVKGIISRMSNDGLDIVSISEKLNVSIDYATESLKEFKDIPAARPLLVETRQGIHWTEKDEHILITLLQSGENNNTIAKELQRTPYAIECRIKYLSIKMKKSGYSDKTIMETFNLNSHVYNSFF